MAESANRDWRIGRSVVQCNKYMLEHEVDCDITFSVGTEKIQAHRYMLISRSAVFHLELTRQDRQQAPMEIIIPEIEPDIFRKMLM